MSDSKEFGKKLVDNAFAEKSGHRIAVIGSEIFGNLYNLKSDDGNYFQDLFRLDDLGNLERLNNYTLIILGYDSLDGSEKQAIFYKQMIEALENGTNFCFLHFNENPHSNRQSSKFNIGYQTLFEFDIGEASQVEEILHEAKILKQEFRPFLKKWGSTKIYFSELNENAKIIYETNDSDTLGFSIPIKNGEVFYLPYIRNHSSQTDLRGGLDTLIDNLLTYLAKSRIDLPKWAKEASFFSDEEIVLSKKTLLQEQIIKLENDLQKFDEAKSLLFQNEHNLEISLPKFLQTHLGLQIEQKETFNEDFWLVDEHNERIAISEIKSKSKGFRKNLVYSVLAHKETYELPDDFPSLLFVNCNLQAGNWMEKDQPLNTQDCIFVKNQNVLVIRVEDIVRLWEMKRLSKITSQEILELFLTKKGWLQITKDLEIKILPEK